MLLLLADPYSTFKEVIRFFNSRWPFCPFLTTFFWLSTSCRCLSFFLASKAKNRPIICSSKTSNEVPTDFLNALIWLVTHCDNCLLSTFSSHPRCMHVVIGVNGNAYLNVTKVMFWINHLFVNSIYCVYTRIKLHNSKFFHLINILKTQPLD